MKRTLLLVSVLGAVLALPSSASARIVELGSVADAAKASCPSDPCEAAVRVTGLQGRAAGGPENPYYIRRDGYIVAFTVQLAQPTAEQVTFFNNNFGTPSQARLAVLRRGDTRKTRLNYRLLAQTRAYELYRYFGSSPTFALTKPLRVKRTNWIAITVPTWAPMYANGLKGSDWWRASRPKDTCDPPRSLRPFAIDELHDVSVFGCTYHKARLMYSATYVPDPRPTSE